MAARRELRVFEVVGAVRPVPQGVALPLGIEAKAQRRDAARPSKKPSAIVRSRPAAALAPRSADMETLLQAPESPRHVSPESPRIQTTAARSPAMDSSATALFYTRKIFAVDPVRPGPRRQAAGASTWTRYKIRY